MAMMRYITKISFDEVENTTRTRLLCSRRWRMRNESNSNRRRTILSTSWNIVYPEKYYDDYAINASLDILGVHPSTLPPDNTICSDTGHLFFRLSPNGRLVMYSFRKWEFGYISGTGGMQRPYCWRWHWWCGLSGDGFGRSSPFVPLVVWDGESFSFGALSYPLQRFPFATYCSRHWANVTLGVGHAGILYVVRYMIGWCCWIEPHHVARRVLVMIATWVATWYDLLDPTSPNCAQWRNRSVPLLSLMFKWGILSGEIVCVCHRESVILRPPLQTKGILGALRWLQRNRIYGLIQRADAAKWLDFCGCLRLFS